jgi:hypothetical protein
LKKAILQKQHILATHISGTNPGKYNQPLVRTGNFLGARVMPRPATTLPPQKANDLDSKVENDHFVDFQTPKEIVRKNSTDTVQMSKKMKVAFTRTVILFPDMSPEVSRTILLGGRIMLKSC